MHLLQALGQALRTASMHAHFEVKKEKKVQQIKREGSIKGEGGLYKKLKIPTLPPKLPRSGVAFHLTLA